MYKNLDKHKHNTRTKCHFQVPLHNITLFPKTIVFRGVQLVNKLPSHVQSLTKHALFKGSLCNLLLKNCFYAVEEYVQTDFNM